MTTKEGLGKFIERMIKERESMLVKKGKIKSGRKLSKSYVAKEILDVSATWFCNVLNGDKLPNDDMLLKLATFLEIDEHELFKVAGRIHPKSLEKFKKEYLGEYY